MSAGHFEAYNYWLFKGARPEEFSEWSKNHKDQFQAWLDWRSKNPLRVRTPDFQRLYMLRKPGRSSTAPASLIHEAGRTASAILPTLQNTCASGDSKCNKQFDQHAKDLKKGLEDLQKKVDKMKDGAEKTKLQSSLKTLGTENDGNNVDVKFGSVAGWAGQVKDGHEGAPSRSNNSGRRSVRGGWNDIWRNIGNRASYEWFDRNRSGRHCWPC